MDLLPTNDDFNSVSEGCFLVLPSSGQANAKLNDKRKRSNQQTKNSSKAKRRQSLEDASPTIKNHGFQQLFSGMESKDCMLLRKNIYHELWDKTNAMMDETLLDLNHAVRQHICHFVNTSDDTRGSSLIPMPYREIPTALVFAGINTPDHTSQFNEIANAVRYSSSTSATEQHHHCVALLSSQNCNSLKNMMSTMIEQFMNHNTSVLHRSSDTYSKKKSNTAHLLEQQQQQQENDEMEMDDEGQQREQETYQLGGNASRSTKPIKLPSHDLQLLAGWYMETVQHLENRQTWPKLVVILQDFESFDPTLLQDFMTIISEYRTDIPFVLVIGIATSTEILHQSLTKSTICLLRIEKFWLQQSDVWFNRVLDKIFIDSDFTMKFGAMPYKFLLDHFYLYDFSISKVKASMKYALMHHFYSNPLSIFLSLAGQSHESILTTLTQWHNEHIITTDHAAHLRMLRSFRQHIEQLVDDPSTSTSTTDDDRQQQKQQKENRQFALQLLNDDTYLLTNQLTQWLVDLGVYQRQFKRGMSLIQFLQSQFPAFSGLGKKTRRLMYLEQLQDTQWVKKAGTVQWLVNLVRKMEASALEPFLAQLQQVLAKECGGGDGIDDPWMKQILAWQAQLATLALADKEELAKIKRKERKYAGLMSFADDDDDHDHLTDKSTSTRRQTKTAEKVHENAIAQIKRAGTLTSKMTMEIADWFQTILSHDLQSYTTMPLHELIYYTHVKLHEKSFAPQPRGSIQTALVQSQYYINCDCCQQPDQENLLLPTEQDTSVLYKLYLECGRMINLYDWFVAFGCVIEREPRPNGHPLKENEIQARFIRSVAELQFLGFIKSTQRKTDHVVRLTWSNI